MLTNVNGIIFALQGLKILKLQLCLYLIWDIMRLLEYLL